MKLKLLATMATVVFTTNSYAQNEFYLKPYAGAGISNIAGNESNVSYLKVMSRDRTKKLKSVPSFSAGIEMGYQVNKWRISTGVGYLQTGNKNDDVLLIFEGFPPVRDSGSVAIKFYHLLVPVNLGYEIGITKKLSITPQTGIALSYNIKRVDDWNTTLNNRKTDISRNTFTSMYHSISVFSNTSINIEYSLAKRLKLVLAPTFYYMLSNMDVSVPNPAYRTTEHPYALHLSVGCYVGL